MTFPIITHINQLKEKISHLDEIRFAEQSNGTTVVCYMIADENTFSGENQDWAKEARGITFDKDGKILVRSMQKFFNVGEREDTQKHVLPWDKVIRLMTKLDGSMITATLIDDKVCFKSKKTFESDVAILADKYATLNDRMFCEDMCSLGYTPTFELTSPEARIVIKYPTTKLTLLHVRENTHGEYLPRAVLEGLAIKYDIDLVRDHQFTDIEDIIEELKTIENFEGYVVQFEDGSMVKLKSDWYLKLHGTITNTTERNVVEMVLDETLDDVISYLNEMNEKEVIEKIRKIEHHAVGLYNELVEKTEEIYNAYKHLERKDFAITLSKDKYFGLAMNKYLGKEPDYKKFYRANILKQEFGCKTI